MKDQKKAVLRGLEWLLTSYKLKRRALGHVHFERVANFLRVKIMFEDNGYELTRNCVERQH